MIVPGCFMGDELMPGKADKATLRKIVLVQAEMIVLSAPFKSYRMILIT